MSGSATPRPEPVAIIGLGCLFPRAGDPAAYWATICGGRDAITAVPPTHWRPEDYLDPDPKSPDHTYVARGGAVFPIELLQPEGAPFRTTH